MFTLCKHKDGVLTVIRYDAGVILCFNKIVVTKQLPSLRGMWIEVIDMAVFCGRFLCAYPALFSIL